MVISAMVLLVCCRQNTSEEAEEKIRFDWVQVDSGTYKVGHSRHYSNVLRAVRIDSFQISPKEVTNAQFALFVEATGYTTTAERMHNAMTFHPPLDEYEWLEDSTAYWRFPNGISGDGIEDKMDHPVTCISYLDALEFCEWAGVRLPTLDEWEVACRAENALAQSDSLTNGPRHFWSGPTDSIGAYANIWHGKDHERVYRNEDFVWTSPVGSFAPNGWGLFDVYGNVFEFCADRPMALADRESLACARGGSWWCSRNSCNFFNSVDVGRVKKWASYSNQGFRVARAAQ